MPYELASGNKKTHGIRISEKSHKEGPASVGGCLMSLRPVIKKHGIRISEKSHKEGPASMGGCLMSLRPAIKKHTVSGSAKNLIRRDPRQWEDAL